MASHQLICKRARFFKYIFTISKVTGFFPYHLFKNRFTLSMSSLITTILAFAFATYHIVRSLFYATNTNLNAKTILWRYTFNLSLYTMLIATWNTSFFRGPFIHDVLAALEEVGHILYTIDPMRNLRHPSIGVKDVLVVMLISIYFIYLPKELSFVSYNLFIGLGIVCIWLNTYQFSSISHLICIYFSETCASLSRVQNAEDFNLAIKSARVLVDVYNRLCDAALLLGKGFEKLLTVQITCTFIGMVVNAFFSIFEPIHFNKPYIYILLPTDNFMETFYKQRCILTIIYLANIWHVSACSSQITNKVEEFNIVLYRIMTHDKSKHLLNDDHLRLHVSKKREVIFKACGFFNLNYTLILSIMASVSTYIVIAEQFK